MSVRSLEVNISASIDWSDNKNYFRLLVSNPLGLPIAALEGNEELIKVILPSKRTELVSSENLHRHIGYHLPLNHFPFWVRGFPNPDYDFVGNDVSFDQDGWRISYSQIQDLLPRKIRLQKEDLILTLLIKSWGAPS